jgi:hypothetical protein
MAKIAPQFVAADGSEKFFSASETVYRSGAFR